MEGVRRSTGGEDYGDEIPKFESTFSRFVSELTRAKCQVTELKRKEQAWLVEKEALLKTTREKDEVRRGMELEISELKDKERILIQENEELSIKIRQKDEELEGSRGEASEWKGRVSSLEKQLEEERAKSRPLSEKGRLFQVAKEELKGAADKLLERVKFLELLEGEESGSRDVLNGSTREGSEWEASNEVGDTDGDGGVALAACEDGTLAPSESNKATAMNETGSKNCSENPPHVEVPSTPLRRSTRIRTVRGKTSTHVNECEDIRPQAAGSEGAPVVGNDTTTVPSSTCCGSQGGVEAEILTTPQASNQTPRKNSGAFFKRKAEAANNRSNDDCDAEDASISTESAKKARTDSEQPPEHVSPLESHVGIVHLQTANHLQLQTGYRVDNGSGESDAEVSSSLSSPSREDEGSIVNNSDDDDVEVEQRSDEDVESSNSECSSDNDDTSNDSDSARETEDQPDADKPRKGQLNQAPGTAISNTEKERFILLKCPDCNGLFSDFRSILLHHKNSESCNVHYHPSQKILVEVFTPPKTEKIDAVISLSRTIFICEDCDLALYSSLDVAKHKELHADFRCDFCNFKCTYAPDLAYHELRHSRIPNKSGYDRVSCARCYHVIFPGKSAKEYVHHFIDKHLNLILNEPICAICKTTVNNLSERDLLEHLKSHHDLNTPPQSKYCCRGSQGLCRASFSTKAQLNEHKKVQHFSSASLYNWRECKCEECYEIFINRQDLKEHRMVHATAPGLFACPVASCHSSELMKCTELRGHILAKGHNAHYVSLNASGTVKLKCPDCDLLFWDPKELLLHRKESNSCQGVYDITKTIRVELLITPRKETNVSELLVKVVYAVINLPQKLYVCEVVDCGFAMYTSAEWKAHKTHHGIFHCQFCDAQRTYAPDIALHELRHHSRRDYETDKIGTKAVMKCPRCLDSWSHGLGNIDYIKHHLETHLSLTVEDKRKCPICECNRFYNFDGFSCSLVNHLRREHDICPIRWQK